MHAEKDLPPGYRFGDAGRTDRAMYPLDAIFGNQQPAMGVRLVEGCKPPLHHWQPGAALCDCQAEP